MKFLVTGFDPFGGEKINPAILAVKQLPDQIKQAEIIKLEIPTVFNKAAEVIKEEIIKQQPDYVLSVGQAGGRACLTPERVAINVNDGSIPDNEGYQPTGEKIQIDGENAYFTQFPIKEEVKAIRAAGIPARISNSAGTYVCNHVMYQVQYLRATSFPNLKAGFIHIPYLPSQAVKHPNAPSMALDDIVKGLTAAIRAILIASDPRRTEIID